MNKSQLVAKVAEKAGLTKKDTGRNPQTGAEIKIAASKNPAFKAGKAFKDAVNSSKKAAKKGKKK